MPTASATWPDLAYKTRRLVEASATQEGLGRLTKTVTFDVKTLEALRGEPGSDEGKVFSQMAARRIGKSGLFSTWF